MKRLHFYIVLTVLTLMFILHLHAYRIDVQYGNYNQQQTSQALATAFAIATLLFGIFVPIKRNNK